MAKASSAAKPATASKQPATACVVWNGAGRLRIPLGNGKHVTLGHGDKADIPVQRVADLREQGINLDVEGK